MKRLVLWLAALFAMAAQAHGGCKAMTFNSSDYTVCIFDTRNEHLALYNLDASGQPYGGFGALRDSVSGQGQTLSFAMNAGMFGEDLKPIGLYVENGRMLHRLNHANGPGNFHLKPNGVFYVAGGKAGVMETEAFAKAGLKPELATQSGPMLVVNGAIHPKLSPSGTSLKLRNGVGVIDEHTVAFVISDDFVSFYDFATLFRDGLHCKNALFLDGSVSSLYAPELGRADFLARIGPMVGVTQPAK